MLDRCEGTLCGTQVWLHTCSFELIDFPLVSRVAADCTKQLLVIGNEIIVLAHICDMLRGVMPRPDVHLTPLEINCFRGWFKQTVVLHKLWPVTLLSTIAELMFLDSLNHAGLLWSYYYWKPITSGAGVHTHWFRTCEYNISEFGVVIMHIPNMMYERIKWKRFTKAICCEEGRQLFVSRGQHIQDHCQQIIWTAHHCSSD